MHRIAIPEEIVSAFIWLVVWTVFWFAVGIGVGAWMF